MAAPTVMSYSRTFPLTPEHAFDSVLTVPLEKFFDQRYGPLPPIKSIEGQDGTWGSVGQSRTVRLADGGSMREQLTTVERGTSFGYDLTELTGPLKPLVSHVQGLWSFAPAGTGTRITWQWTVHPTSGVTAPLLPVLRKLWTGYAAKAFQRIEDLVVE